MNDFSCKQRELRQNKIRQQRLIISRNLFSIRTKKIIIISVFFKSTSNLPLFHTNSSLQGVLGEETCWSCRTIFKKEFWTSNELYQAEFLIKSAILLCKRGGETYEFTKFKTGFSSHLLYPKNNTRSCPNLPYPILSNGIKHPCKTSPNRGLSRETGNINPNTKPAPAKITPRRVCCGYITRSKQNTVLIKCHEVPQAKTTFFL